MGRSGGGPEALRAFGRQEGGRAETPRLMGRLEVRRRPSGVAEGAQEVRGGLLCLQPPNGEGGVGGYGTSGAALQVPLR